MTPRSIRAARARERLNEAIAKSAPKRAEYRPDSSGGTADWPKRTADVNDKGERIAPKVRPERGR